MFLKKLSSMLAIPKIRLFGISGICYDWSDDNLCEIHGSVEGALSLFGERNRFELEQGASYKGRLRIRGSGNLIKIGKNCAVSAKIEVNGNNQIISIGDGTTIKSGYILCSENCNITIGRYCLISRHVEIRTSDAHSLVDTESNRRINHAASVNIGDHVWIGVNVLINKGSSIPEDCVIGAKSFVNKAFEESQVVIAGAPARIVRRNVTWNRGIQDSFSNEDLYDWRNESAHDHKPTE